MHLNRRRFLQVGGGTGLAIAYDIAQSRERAVAETPGKILIGYPTIAAGLPFFYAVEKGLFKEAGLDVEAKKFVNPQQIIEGMIAGQLQGCSNGTPSGALAIAQVVSPNFFKIIVSNPTNRKFVLDQFIVAKNSPIRSIAELKGKKVGCGPGPQDLAVTKGILAKNGITDAQILQLDRAQHPAAVTSGSIAAAYTLEPNGTIGTLNGLTRVLETGVVAKYILGDPRAPWFGGSAALTTKFITTYPKTAQKYIQAYRKAVDFVRKNPNEARASMVGYTPITGKLVNAVPLPDYRVYDEFSSLDLKHFQGFYDFLLDSKILTKKVQVAPLLYKPSR